MSKKENERRFNRRSVLKTAGAVGTMGAVSSTVSAVEGAEKDSLVQEAIQTDSFENFESQFGDITVQTGESQVTRQGEAGKRAVRVEMQTNLGKMGVIMLEQSDDSVDMTVLDLSAANAGALPAKYANVPEETTPLLIATSGEDEIEFRRSATEREKRALAEVTGIRPSELQANLESKRGGFVVSGGSELNEDDYFVVQLDDIVVREVSASTITAQTVQKKQVSAQLDWWCTYKCGSCITKASSCVGCCLAVYIGCIGCIIWNCGLGANSCYDCYGCLN